MSWTKNISKVEIGTGVTEIGANTFNGAEAFTSVKIPSSVTGIGVEAFANTPVKEVDIDDIESFCNITFGNEAAHPNYNGLCTLKVNGSVCTNLVIPSGVSSIKSYMFEKFDSINTVTIPQSVTWIGDNAFYYCSELARVDFGGPCNIGSSAFSTCTHLRNVYMLTETMEQVQVKANYPWGLSTGCTIHCKDGNIVVQGGSGYSS